MRLPISFVLEGHTKHENSAASPDCTCIIINKSNQKYTAQDIQNIPW
jgi:hypothetical protein